MSDSLAAAHLELYNLLNNNVSGISAYYDHEPMPGVIQKGTVALTVATNGWTADYWRLVVRVYTWPSTSSAKQAADDLDAYALAIVNKVSTHFECPDMDATYDREQGHFMGTITLLRGREDF